jgi:hypothetical protein
MADFYRVNGTTLPNGFGTFVSFIGKQPTAYGVKLAGASGAANVYTETGPNDALAGIFKTISANATILGYQVENAGSSSTPANVSILLEAPSEFTATNIQNIIRGGGNGAGWYGNAGAFDASQTIVTDTGFKLAYS